MTHREPWILELDTAATVGPLTVADCKRHANVDGTLDDDVIQTYLTAAVEYYQETADRQLINATFKLYLERFFDLMKLPRPPLSSVTSVSYLDTNGVEQTLSADVYEASSASQNIHGEVRRTFGQSWPAVRVGQKDSVTIEYVAGYGADDTFVPERHKQILRALVATQYRFRETILVGAPQSRLVDVGDRFAQAGQSFFETPWM